MMERDATKQQANDGKTSERKRERAAERAKYKRKHANTHDQFSIYILLDVQNMYIKDANKTTKSNQNK